MTINETPNQPLKVVAGFWMRVIADIIDVTILWVFGIILGFFLESWFVKLGENGVWIGLFISLAYFVPMQSSFGNGQSLGKRMLGIQVLDMNGQALSLSYSFLRYLIIALVAYNGVFTGVLNLVGGSSIQILAGSIMTALWFIALAGCYLLVPLHPLKRGFHDLAAGSVVVYRGKFDKSVLAAMDDPAKTKKAFGIVGAISLIALAVGIWSILAISKNASMTDMRDIKSKLESTGKFRSTSVMDNTFKNSFVATRSIILESHVDGPLSQTKEDLKPYYDLAFQAIRDQIKDISQYNNLRVGLRVGYDIGIRKRYSTWFQDENPAKPGERKDSGSRSNF